MDIYERLMQRQKENQPFLDFIGAVSEEVGPGRAVITLKPRPEHMNYRGIVHGGCLFNLADSAAGLAASSRGRCIVTLSSSFNYLLPAKDTEKIIAEATEVKYGRTIAVYDVTVKSHEGKLLCKGTFDYYVLGENV